MKRLVGIVILCVQALVMNAQSIWIMDFVEVKNDNVQEAEYFIQQNWKVFREEALKKHFIKSYQVLKTRPDSTASFSYVLMTEFADSVSFKAVEENFRPIMKALRPNGPIYLNELRRQDFWAIPVSKEAVQIIGSRK